MPCKALNFNVVSVMECFSRRREEVDFLVVHVKAVMIEMAEWQNA